MTKNRTFTLLPPFLQTDTNKRAMSVVDDVVFEPSNIEKLSGQIGSPEGTSASRLASDPFIATTQNNQQNQLAPCVITRGTGGVVEGGVFYEDIIRTLEANGANVSDPGRMFETDYFVLNLPIDIDMWSNFQRYYWTGPGTSATLAEYVTKDPIYTQLNVYQPDGSGGWTRVSVPVVPVAELPGSPDVGDIYDYGEVSEPGLFRRIVKWDGSDWVPQLFKLVEELPVSSSNYSEEQLFYVARYGHEYLRTTFAVWSPEAQRWVMQLAVHQAKRPENPTEGMIWEDATDLINRYYRTYANGQWTAMNYDLSVVSGVEPSDLGIPETPPVARLLLRSTTGADGWSVGNWWRHYDDLSPTDQIAYASNQAFRPIISFWPFIESLGDVKSDRNQPPLFETYSFDANHTIVQTKTLTPVYNGSSIFAYKRTTGSVDTVLGFTPVHDARGEIAFDITLESQTYPTASPTIKGYRFFKDTSTDKYWSVWMKAPTPLAFDPSHDAVPPNMVRNPDHLIETDISRSNIIEHYQHIIEATATGPALGSNNYRWTSRDPVAGASIIDAEGSLLRLGFTYSNTDYDMPEAIREASRQYARFFKRFNRILNTLWSSGQNSNPNGTLISGLTTTNMVDRVLTNMYINLDADRPYGLSGMGTYQNEINGTVLPIAIPPSPPRLGVAPLYEPMIFMDLDGMKILCHDGRVINAFGDDRDDIILNLEARFFAAVPAKRRLETLTESAWLDENGFDLRRFVGHRAPETSLPDIDRFTVDYTVETPPGVPASYYSLTQNVFAYWNGAAWALKSLPSTGVFHTVDDNAWRIITDYGTAVIAQPDTNGWVPDYSIAEYKAVIYREFEHWRALKSVDPTQNTTYDQGDRLTWNYRSSGHEGHVKAIYQRFYGTSCPHIRPWEIWGFTVKPAWWDDYFTADGSDPQDGLDRWADTNPMWDALADPSITTLADDGIVIPSKYYMRWTAPVDGYGELIDPIAAGILDEDSVIGASAEWKYGDGAPVEQLFIESPEGVYSTVLAAYLMKPSRVVDRLWADYMFTVGDANLQGERLLVDDATLKRSPISTQSVHTLDGLSDPGLGSLVVDRLRLNGKSIDDYVSDLHSTQVTIGWKTEGFVDKKTLSITTMAGKDIPQEDIALLVHKGPPTSVEVHSGVYVIKIGSQYQVFGYDFSAPHFTVDIPTKPIRGGQIILDQRYTVTDPTQTIYTLTEFAVGVGEQDRFYVILNGDRVESHQVKIIDRNRFQLVDVQLEASDSMTARLHTTTSNPSTRVKSFKIEDYIYTYNDTSSGETTTVDYGTFLNSEQEVVQFLADYGRYLVQRGWSYPNTDWVDEARRFAVWSRTATDLEILIMCPSAKQLEFVVAHGHVDDLSKSQYGGPPVLDLSASPAEDLTIMRLDDRVTIITKDGAYLIRLAIVEYQHAAIFSPTTRFSDVIYDPFTGTYHKRLFVDALRIKDWRGRLETPGYVLSQEGLGMNFETAATEFVNSYDTRSSNAVSVNKRQALDLYNFSVKTYMRQFHLDTEMSFDYHKRAIQEKGTSRALMAFANVKSEATPIEIRECWAWHLSSYGYSAPDPFTVSIDAGVVRDRSQLIVFGGDPVVNAYMAPGFSEPNSPDWIVPPVNPAFSFVERPTGSFVSLIAFDEVGIPFEQYFEWHPIEHKHDPIAYREIDIEASTDPAGYTTSPNTNNVTGEPWGADKVGTIWWDTSNRRYADYTNPDVFSRLERVDMWGDLAYLSLTSVSDADYGFAATSAAPHGLSTDSSFYIKTKQGDTFQALVLTVPSTTTFTFVTMDGPESTDILNNAPNASDFNRVVLGSIDVYQWIGSALSPVQYADIGTPYSAQDPSWTEVVQSDGSILYYFWAKNGGEVLGNHKIGLEEITRRLITPASVLSPWFAVIDGQSILIDTAPLENRQEYSIQFVFTPRHDKQHNEWLLIPEGDDNWSFPADIKSRIYASVVGYDADGRQTPSALLPTTAQVGNGRQQTIFRNQALAREEFLSVLNRMLKLLNRYVSPNFTRAFEDGQDYWSYVDFDTHGREVSERVYTVAQRDQLVDLRDGDVVKVDNVRLMDGDQLFESYLYEGGAWSTIQAEAGTAELNDGFFDVFYTYIGEIETYLGNGRLNALLFSLLYEMVRQNERCDWFFKTSYVDLRLTLETGQPNTVGRDEFELIKQNVEEFKPFRSKVRKYISSQRLYNGDDPYDAIEAEVTEEQIFKTAMYIDRLSCNLFDDHSFDMEPFDDGGFDFQPWEYDVLGTEEWNTVGEFDSQAAVKRYVVGMLPRQNDFRVLAFDSQDESIAVAPYQFEFETDVLYVNFLSFPALGVTYRVQMTQATASQALIDATIQEVALGAAKSTWLHAAAANRITMTGVHNNRVVSEGTCGDFNNCGDCNDADGGDSEERLRTDAADRLFLKTSTYSTELYSGFDATPFDYVPMDQKLGSHNVRSFYSAIAPQGADTILDTELVTSTTFTVDSDDETFGLFQAPETYYTITHIQATLSGNTRVLDASEWSLETNFIANVKTGLSVGDTIVLLYGEIQLHSPICNFENADIGTDYSIVDGDILKFDDVPPIDGSVLVVYLEDTLPPDLLTAKASYAKYSLVVDEVMTDHLNRQGSSVVNVGYRIFNSTDHKIYTWNGTTWTSITVVNGTYFYDRSAQILKLYNTTLSDVEVLSSGSYTGSLPGGAPSSSVVGNFGSDVATEFPGSFGLVHRIAPAGYGYANAAWSDASLKVLNDDDTLDYWGEPVSGIAAVAYGPDLPVDQPNTETLSSGVKFLGEVDSGLEITDVSTVATNFLTGGVLVVGLTVSTIAAAERQTVLSMLLTKGFVVDVIGVSTNQFVLEFAYYYNNGSQHRIRSAVITTSHDTPYYFGISYNAATQAYAMTINGVSITPVVINTQTSTATTAVSTPMYLGNAAAGTTPFNGILHLLYFGDAGVADPSPELIKDYTLAISAS